MLLILVWLFVFFCVHNLPFGIPNVYALYRAAVRGSVTPRTLPWFPTVFLLLGFFFRDIVPLVFNAIYRAI